MSYSRRSRYSVSPSPKRYDRSVSRSPSRSRSRSCDSSDVENPGNNLYVTGLSTRVTKRDLERHFSTEGKVEDIHLVVDPWTRESRGFCFVTLSTLEEAERCIKYLNRTVLEGRVITVEKARRCRGRTPTPGRYLGLKSASVRRRSPSYSPYLRSRSPRYSSRRYRSRSRSHSPYYSRHRRSYSPYGRHRSYSPYYSCGRSCSRSRSPCSRSPVSRRDWSYSPDDRYCRSRRDYSPEERYYRNFYCARDYSPDYSRGRSRYRSISPRYRSSRRSYSRSASPRSYSRSRSPVYSSRSYSSSVSLSPKRVSGKDKSPSISPGPIKSMKRSGSQGPRKRSPSCDSRSSRSHSRSPSASSSSRYGSRSAD